ncbi:DNA topoisomerase IB [Patulibacter defluvii]|uniref:DNA topoisomerase IB n=1 Tax=Patulibacter defluvii TaxID=3095358 RepID=UPI002A74DD72|nr:DNA topoisomerase IB [Patulibacter sp. DM4]
MPRLRRSDPAEPGIARVGAGRGFFYRDPEGRRIRDEATLERIAALAIPPAWREVWICPDPLGHLQAVGYDAAGRRQYRYHERWRARRDQQKFDRVLELAGRLPQLRAALRSDLRREGMPRERALACAVRLLDLGVFRIGSERYAEQHETYGLATLERRHVRIEDDELVFDYPAKGGQRRILAITDDASLEVVRTLRRRRGGSDRLLAFKDGRRWRDLGPDDVNGYLREHAGECSAKDFRTWNGTVLAALAIAERAAPGQRRSARERAIRDTIAGVAAVLGNTPAVARDAYVDPRVFDRYRSGWTIAARVAELGGPEAFADPEGRIAIEDAVRDLIDDARDDSPALARVNG